MRASFRLTVFTLVCMGSAHAADLRVPMPGGQTLTIRADAGWVLAKNAGDAPEGAVSLTGADAAKWRITIAPLPPHPTLTGDTGNLRIYVRNMARGLENGGANVEEEHRTLQGQGVSGFYVQARDTRKKTKAQIAKNGDYTDTFVGAVTHGGKPWLFEIVWVSGGEESAQAALAAVRTMRIQ
jgi:hypothetical protein